jgi:catechol 2,3-dioxygenase-like lactoylglutathione lyase family enzyme
MISAFDHIALVVRDLDAARARLEALLGLTPEWIGADGGARHAWFQMGNIALDVIAPTGPGLTGDMVAARLASHGEGIWALAFAIEAPEKFLRTLSNRGLSPSPLGKLRVIREGATERRYWQMSTLMLDPLAGHPVFLIDQAQGFDWPQAAQGRAPVTGIDHVVIRTGDPVRAAATYGARLGLDLRMDRTVPEFGGRMQFFRCGDAILEVVADAKEAGESDRIWGLSWRVDDAQAAHARMKVAGFDVSDVRKGRKPGTEVFTVRDAPAGVPTLMVAKVKADA